MRKILLIECCLFALLLAGCSRSERMETKTGTQIRKMNGSPIIHSLTLQNLDSLVERTQQAQECQVDSAKILCTAPNGKRIELTSWEIPSGPQSDGDGTTYSLLGPLRSNPRFLVLLASLGHDAPTVILWHRHSGCLVFANPGNYPFYFSGAGDVFLSDESEEQGRGPWTIWNGFDAEPTRMSCRLRSGRITFDSTVTITSPTMETRRIELGGLPSAEEVECHPEPAALDYRVPDYMLKPPDQDSLGDDT